jgi:hypothetical protein
MARHKTTLTAEEFTLAMLSGRVMRYVPGQWDGYLGERNWKKWKHPAIVQLTDRYVIWSGVYKEDWVPLTIKG